MHLREGSNPGAQNYRSVIHVCGGGHIPPPFYHLHFPLLTVSLLPRICNISHETKIILMELSQSYCVTLFIQNVTQLCHKPGGISNAGCILWILFFFLFATNKMVCVLDV
jgi:hypothetical protein